MAFGLPTRLSPARLAFEAFGLVAFNGFKATKGPFVSFLMQATHGTIDPVA